jgi:methylase of polypeptide subunit release factors
MLIEETPFARQKFDGAGSVLKTPFVEAVRRLGRTFEHGFEWCSGMGEIGYAVLGAGLCRQLCLADINPAPLQVAKEIALREGLEKNVRIFQGDNMDAVPQKLRFDLVVANPPNYYNVQKDHPAGALWYKDLRPNDRGWQIHEKFYAAIRSYLAPDAVMLIEEIEPFRKEVHVSVEGKRSDVPYDIRDEVPMDTFDSMTRRNGLKIVDVDVLWDFGDIKSYVLKIIPA